jgi:hypothetical protein
VIEKGFKYFFIDFQLISRRNYQSSKFKVTPAHFAQERKSIRTIKFSQQKYLLSGKTFYMSSRRNFKNLSRSITILSNRFSLVSP